MNGKKIILMLVTLVFTACENGNEPVISTIIEGETTIFTKGDSSCFSFVIGKPIPYYVSDDIIPDFWASVYLNERGDPFGIGFCSISLKNSFGIFEHPVLYSLSKKFFDTLSYIIDDIHYEPGIVVNKADVYAVKTQDSNYALIFIKDAKYYRDTTITDYELYEGYVTFKWKYQTNGSRSFKN